MDTFKRQVSSEQGIDQCVREMQAMLKEHGFISVEIKRGHRSLSQNALYWMWLGKIADYINDKHGSNFKPEEIHVRMKHDFLGYEPARKIGGVMIEPQLKSTSKLTKGEMHHYLRQVEQWAAESMGLLLPRPEDSQYEQLRQMQVA